MQYKYRWYYAISLFLGLIAIVFYVDIFPAWLEIASLEAERNNLLNDLGHQQVKLTHLNHQAWSAPATQPKKLADLFALAHASGLTIQVVNRVGQRASDWVTVDKVHLEAIADFAAITTFLSALKQQSNMALVTDFSYKLAERDKFILNFDLLLWQGLTREPLQGIAAEVVLPAYNPFCFMPKHHPVHNDLLELQRYPLAQLTMIGYLKQDHRVYAIVLLPSHAMLDVGLGFVLGKEQGVVVAIQPHYIEVMNHGVRQRVMQAGTV